MDGKIVMCGCHEVGWHSIKYLLENGIKIDYFVSLNEGQAKKYNVSGYKSFEDLATTYDIPIHFVKDYSLKSEEDLSFFRKHKFDLLIQGGWQRLFPEEVLSTLRVGAVGGHGSSEFLPKGRGRSPINWSLIEGKNRFIMHYFIIKPGIDDGDIFHYEMFDINQWDNCRTLYYKNSLISKKVFKEWIPRLLAGEFKVIKQTGEPTYYPKRTPEDGQINWQKTVFEIHDFIRALTYPYPGAFSHLNNARVTFWQANPFDTRIGFMDKRDGEVIDIFERGELLVNCNSGLLLVTEYDSDINIQVGDIFE